MALLESSRNGCTATVELLLARGADMRDEDKVRWRGDYDLDSVCTVG